MARSGLLHAAPRTLVTDAHRSEALDPRSSLSMVWSSAMTALISELLGTGNA
jgi:hypothetical protein